MQDFTPTQKKEILKAAQYKCAVCGMGKNEGTKLHISYIKSKESGTKAELENAQVLCTKHNRQIKKYGAIEFGKKRFNELLKQAKKTNNQKMINFCQDALSLYNKHGINELQ